MLIQFAFAFLLPALWSAPNGQIGKKAPDFSLDSISGEAVTLSALRGKTVLLNFWATWCGPCREELPELGRLQEVFRSRGLVVIGISVDNDIENVSDFLQKFQVRMETLWDRHKKIAAAYRVEQMPSTYIIDPNGVIKYIHRGYSPEEIKKIVAEIEEVLGRPRREMAAEKTK